MKKVLILSLILILILSATVLAMGKRVDKAATTKVEESSDAVTCPVMGTKLKKSAAVDTAEYKGKTYYFCCGGCKPAFEKDPEKYINK